MSRPYGIPLIDDLHTYFPAIIYNPERFTTTQSLLQYIQQEVRIHTDIFSRNRDAFRESVVQDPIRTPPSIRRRPFVEQVEFILQQPQHTPVEDELLAASPALSTRINNSINLLNNALLTDYLFSAIQTPVLVRPSLEQISAATVLRQASSDDEEAQCSICQDGYTEGQAIRTIQHCHHAFHKNCIDPWFQRNVRCPVCRYDIREHGVLITPP
jgi:hypothetical protein